MADLIGVGFASVLLIVMIYHFAKPGFWILLVGFVAFYAWLKITDYLEKRRKK
jgi:predicted PurR-regulated permease PerM